MDSASGDGPALIALDLPPEVRACVRAVRGSREHVFAVGGVVRDTLLGIPIDDWDFATAVRPEGLIGALSAFGAPSAITRLGRVAVDVAGFQVVFTTFREEADYGPERRPASVRFVDSPERDAARRDFTTNALYVDTEGGGLTDPTGGWDDLRARRLRVIGEPRSRLAEDPLRILRAVRFEASRGLWPTAATAAAMAEMAPRCAGLTAERRFAELHRALVEPRAAVAVRRLLDIGALGFVVPELAGDEARVRREAVPLVERSPARDGASEWAALLGSPGVAERAMAALHAPRALRRKVVGLLELAADWDRGPESGSPQARRRRLAEAPDDAVAFVALRLRSQGQPERADRLLDEARRAVAADRPLPSGRDVIGLGVPPGPAVGRILAAVQRSVDADGLTEPAAIARVLEREVARWVKARPDEGR